MSEYRFRGYCHVCSTASGWFETADEAREWRQEHFDDDHEDNPMWKGNTATQRYPIDDIPAEELA